MPLTLTITDNLAGTGGTATISGSDPASTNTLYRSSFTGRFNSYTMTSAGSRTGDGTISLSGMQGYSLWQVVSVLAGSSTVGPIVYQNLSDATTQSVMDRILDATKQLVVSLNLTGITSTNIIKRWLPRYLKTIDSVPMVVVAPINGENFPGVMISTDDVSYPVAIVLVDKQNMSYSDNFTRNLLWRQKISRAFRFQRLSGVSEVINAIPDQQTVIDFSAFDQANLFVSVVGMRFISREPRGLS